MKTKEMQDALLQDVAAAAEAAGLSADAKEVIMKGYEESFLVDNFLDAQEHENHYTAFNIEAGYMEEAGKLRLLEELLAAKGDRTKLASSGVIMTALIDRAMTIGYEMGRAGIKFTPCKCDGLHSAEFGDHQA